MQSGDRHHARRTSMTTARIHKKKKKLPRREGIAKLAASRFSSAIIEKEWGAARETESRINEEKK